jgi:2-C-methyl-D-erythritol 4-phosphate cytidylyltransferase
MSSPESAAKGMDSGDAAPTPAVAVIVVAAGSGQRLGYGIPKARVPLGGEPILMHTLRGIIAAGVARQVCVALPKGDGELRS